MTKLTESEIETYAIGLFEKLGYQYAYAPAIAPDGDTPERARFEDVLLDRLRAAVARLNPRVPADAREEAIRQVQRLNSPELITNNEAFHRLLTEGIKVTYQERGNARGDLVWLAAFARPENNEFVSATTSPSCRRCRSCARDCTRPWNTPETALSGGCPMPRRADWRAITGLPKSERQQ